MGAIFTSEGLSLEYKVSGHGSRPLFAFHGFGSNADLFLTLETSLGKSFKIYSFNLPYHGNSALDDKTTALGVSPLQMQKFFKSFLSNISADEFSLAGYSIGGKVALALITLFPDQVKDVFLFAPDGIKVSPWYRFVTHTSAGRWIYKKMMLNPESYMRIVGILEKLKLIHPRTANFVRGNLHTEESMGLVYQTWQCFRNLDTDIRQVQDIINRKEMNFHLFFGSYDKVIPASIGENFMQGIRNKKDLHILESGHQLIKPELNAVIEKILSA